MRIVIAVVALASLALAACSGDEASMVEEAPVGSSPQPVSTEVPTTADDTSSEETPTHVTTKEPTPVATSLPAVEETGLTETIASDPTPRPPTLPTVGFPDDIALIGSFHLLRPLEGAPRDLVRIYRDRQGRVVRETLFDVPGWWGATDTYTYPCEDRDDDYSVDYSGIQTLTGRLPECGGHSLRMEAKDAKPDGSSLVMTVCVKRPCEGGLSGSGVYGKPDTWADGRTSLYESRDGGVTWEKLADFDAPWHVERFLPAGDGETRLLLFGYHRPPGSNAVSWSPGEGIEELPDPPPAPDGYELGRDGHPVYLLDGRFAWLMRDSSVYDVDTPPPSLPSLYLAEDGEDVTGLVISENREREQCREKWWWCRRLPDGRMLLEKTYSADELIGTYGAAEGRPEYYGQLLTEADDIYFPWLAIQDSPTSDPRPILLPHDAFKPEDVLDTLVAIQQGPFLRVGDVEGVCLSVRAEASIDAEELACVAERVLLMDLDEARAADGEELPRNHFGRVLVGPLLRVIDYPVGNDCLPIRSAHRVDAGEMACIAKGELLTEHYSLAVGGGDGVIWHRVQTPTGVVGWAYGHHLERMDLTDQVIWHKVKTPAGVLGWADGRYLE